MGKVVKMRGRYTRYTTDDTETLHHACVVQDATACAPKASTAADGDYPDRTARSPSWARWIPYRNRKRSNAPGLDPTRYGIVLDICILQR